MAQATTDIDVVTASILAGKLEAVVRRHGAPRWPTSRTRGC